MAAAAGGQTSVGSIGDSCVDGVGHRVQGDHDAVGLAVGIGVLAELVREGLEALAELDGAGGGEPGEAAAEHDATLVRGVTRGVDEAGPDGLLDLVAGGVEHGREGLVEHLAAGLGVAGEQAAVQLERLGDHAIAGLDDPGDDASLDGADQVPVEQQVDVVVEPRLREPDLRRQLLDGPGRIPALDHGLEDPQARRVRDRTQALDVTDEADVLGLEVGIQRCLVVRDVGHVVSCDRSLVRR